MLVLSCQCACTVQDEQDDEEAELRGLKGLKVKHTADELQEGETMILTLADKNILDDKGELDEEEQDELENVLAVRLPVAISIQVAFCFQADLLCSASTLGDADMLNIFAAGCCYAGCMHGAATAFSCPSYCIACPSWVRS